MEEEGIQQYVHLSTGNYNDVTARIYTDISLLTCAGRFGEDASAVFNALSGFSDSPRLKKIVMAPTMLRKRFYELIEREVAHVRAGRKGLICAKMNALVDPGIIEALYKASMAGVVIDLLVRGTCSLRPGLPGISENISVRSIVGRYLEHSRIYWFGNGGEPEVYLSSADWMERNMDRRVELLFPIEDESLRRRVEEILFIYASDTQKARFMNADGVYRKRDRRRKKGPGTGKGTGVVCPVQPEAFTDKLVSELREQHGTRLEAQALFMTLAARADERARQQGRGLGAIPGPVS